MNLKIETPTDWWRVLEDNWEDVYDFVCNHSSKRLSKLEPELDPEERPFSKAAEAWKKERKYEPFVRLFNNAWWKAPEYTCRDHPGWMPICTLCSEEYVLYHEEEEETTNA